MTTQPQKTANEPFWQAAVRRFGSTQSTPGVVIPPLASHTRKGPEHRAYKPQFRQKRKRSRSPAGPRRRRKRTHAVNAHIRFLRLVVSSHGQPHTEQRRPVFAPVSRCVASFGEGAHPGPRKGFQADFKQI